MLLNDFGSVETSREITPEGFLKVSARIARVGVLDYRAFEFSESDLPDSLKTRIASEGPNSIIRLFRPADEVFKKESLESFTAKPVTVKHPRDFVDSSNVKGVQVGFSRDNVRRDGSFIRADLVIQDRETIRRIEADGLSEVSIGADAEIEWVQGTDDSGMHYDGRIRNIRGNHIALVPKGRAGHEVRLDDESRLEHNTDNQGVKMSTRKFNGLTIELADQAAEAFDALELELKDAKAAADKISGEMEAKLEDAKKEIDELKGSLDAEKAKALSDADVEALVTERMALVDAAKTLDPELDCSGKSPREIKVAAVAKVVDSFDAEEKSDDYVNAYFEATLKSHKPKVDTAAKMAKGLEDSAKVEEKVDNRQKMIDEQKEAYRLDV